MTDAELDALPEQRRRELLSRTWTNGIGSVPVQYMSFEVIHNVLVGLRAKELQARDYLAAGIRHVLGTRGTRYERGADQQDLVLRTVHAQHRYLMRTEWSEVFERELRLRLSLVGK